MVYPFTSNVKSRYCVQCSVPVQLYIDRELVSTQYSLTYSGTRKPAATECSASCLDSISGGARVHVHALLIVLPRQDSIPCAALIRCHVAPAAPQTLFVLSRRKRRGCGASRALAIAVIAVPIICSPAVACTSPA